MHRTVASPAAEPFWAAPALLAALLAALGFLGKTATDLIGASQQAARARRSRLVELYALIRAGDAAFAAQSALRRRLARQLQRRLAGAVDLSGAMSVCLPPPLPRWRRRSASSMP